MIGDVDGRVNFLWDKAKMYYILLEENGGKYQPRNRANSSLDGLKFKFIFIRSRR